MQSSEEITIKVSPKVAQAYQKATEQKRASLSALISIFLKDEGEIESLQNPPTAQLDRSSAIQKMRGLLKTKQPAPTDQEITTMLEERRVEKYL